MNDVFAVRLLGQAGQAVATVGPAVAGAGGLVEIDVEVLVVAATGITADEDPEGIPGRHLDCRRDGVLDLAGAVAGGHHPFGECHGVVGSAGAVGVDAPAVEVSMVRANTSDTAYVLV